MKPCFDGSAWSPEFAASVELTVGPLPSDRGTRFWPTKPGMRQHIFTSGRLQGRSRQFTVSSRRKPGSECSWWTSTPLTTSENSAVEFDNESGPAVHVGPRIRHHDHGMVVGPMRTRSGDITASCRGEALLAPPRRTER